MIDHLSSMLEIFSSQMADISLSEISMMEDRLPLRREKLRFLMESRDIAKSRMHACKNLAHRCCICYLLLHEARFREEQKNLQMEAWRCMHLPSAGAKQNEKCWRTTRKTRHCTERKELQVYPKDNRKGCIARKRKLCVLVEAL